MNDFIFSILDQLKWILTTQQPVSHRQYFLHLNAELYTLATWTISLAGILSNLVVCYLILRFNYLRSIVNLLILNLAISDIVAGVAVYPYIFLEIPSTSIRGSLANFLCGLTEGLAVFFIAASVSLLTLSILSISRYLVINHPLRLSWRLEKSNLKWIFAFVWVVSTALLLPSSLSFYYNESSTLCDRAWAPGVHRMTYFIFDRYFGICNPTILLGIHIFYDLVYTVV